MDGALLGILKQSVNSGIGTGTMTPINAIVLLNDLKTWGEESFVYKDKNILHAFYKDYSLSINEPFFNQDVWEYVLNGGLNQTDVGKALSNLSGLSSSVKNTLRGMSTLNQVLWSETVMDALAENETAVTLFGYIKHYDHGADIIDRAVTSGNIPVVFKHGNLANALLLSDDGTYTNTSAGRNNITAIRRVLQANDVEGWTYLQQIITEGYSSLVYDAIVNADFINEYLPHCTNSAPLHAIAEYVNTNYTDAQVQALYNAFKSMNNVTEVAECGGGTSKDYLHSTYGFAPVFLAIYQTRSTSYTSSYPTHPYIYMGEVKNAANRRAPCTVPKNDNNESSPYRVATTDPSELVPYIIGLSFVGEYSLYMSIDNASYSRYAVYIMQSDDWDNTQIHAM